MVQDLAAELAGAPEEVRSVLACKTNATGLYMQTLTAVEQKHAAELTCTERAASLSAAAPSIPAQEEQQTRHHFHE